MKITKKELQEIIKEEALKFKRALELKKELTEIEKQLSEVYAGEPLSTEKQGGVHAGQRKSVFKKKGSALVEDEMEEEVSECGMEGKEVPMEECKVEEEIEEPKEEGMEDETIAENLDEPIEGESVAQKAEDSKIDDGMEKSKYVKESVETLRMKKLAGIIKG